MRRGLSTIVGAVFFVVAISSVAAYVSISMNSLDDLAQSIIVKDAQSIDRLKEDIEITTVTLTDTNKFNMTVFNKGPISTKLTRLWVTDQSSNPITHQKEDLNVLINPGEQKQNIATNLSITANPTDSYTLKVVTERGNTASFVLYTDISTQIDLIVPAQVLPKAKIYVIEIITNNSTTLSTIANITGIMKNDATLTPTETPTPTYKLGFDKDEMATFTWTFVAPSSDGLVKFNASYVGAPSGAYVEKIVEVESLENTQEATSTQWSEKARRVGILISGLPNPVEGDPGGGSGHGKYGIGIINPLDRPVEVYALALSSPLGEIFKNTNPVGEEPIYGWSTLDLDLGEFSVLLWESSNDCNPTPCTGTPRLVPGESIVEWKVELPNDEGDSILEAPIFVESLTSEGKLLAIYTLTSDEKYPTMNIFYTDDISDPLNNWTYKHDDIPSGQRTQYNVTVQNSSDNRDLTAEVALTIFIPKDFSNIQADDGQTGWDNVIIVKNPDNSHFIKVDTTATSFAKSTYKNFSFNATAPVVTEKSLYVFATTTFYPKWSIASQDSGPEIASAISEAGVIVVPPGPPPPPPPPPPDITHGPFTFDADNDADESAWTFVSDFGTNGLLPSGSTRSWSHDTNETPSTGVGPQSGQGGNPDGYVYTEASSPAALSDTFHMTFDTTLNASTETWQIEFYTNQRGNDNHVVAQVQINENGGGWVNVGSSFGGEGGEVATGGNDVWTKRTVDLSNSGANTDSSTQVRILLTFPSSVTNVWHNDYGIDTVTITGVTI